MNPTQKHAHRRKYLLPIAIVIIVVAAGLIIVNGKIADQGASLFTGVTKTSSLRAIPPVASNCRPTVGANGVPVAPAPSIKVASPNGGEVYSLSDNFHAQWGTCNVANANLWGARVEIVDMATPNVAYLIGQGESGFGSTVMHTPSIAQAPSIGTRNFKVKVTQLGQNGVLTNIVDWSDNLFTINRYTQFSLIGTPTLTLSQSIDGVAPGQEDVFVAKFRVRVTADSSDIYIPDTANMVTVATLTGVQPINKGITPISSSSSNSGYWVVNAGSSVDFDYMVYLAGSNTSEKVTLTGIPYRAPTMSSPALTYTPPATTYKTPTVFLAK